MTGGLSQRARVMAQVASEIDAYMRRPCDRAHPSGLTEIQRINSDTRRKILARAEWDAMDDRGQLPADWPQRRAALIQHLQRLRGAAMGDDWKPGDLALCVRDDGTYTQAARTYIVRDVFLFGQHREGFSHGMEGVIGLRFVGIKFLPGDWCDSKRFTKQRPHTPDAEDRETIALLNGTPAPPAPSKPEEVGK